MKRSRDPRKRISDTQPAKRSGGSNHRSLPQENAADLFAARAHGHQHGDVAGFVGHRHGKHDQNVEAGDEGVRFLLVSGRPIREPVAWHGPIVMNTQTEIQQALSDLRDGTFIGRPPPGA